MCQRVTQWSKVCLVRLSRESKALGTVDREAHLRSLTEQARAAEYQGNVKILYKLTREAEGQPRIKSIPSVMMDDNTTMTLGSVQTDGRWRQYFAKLLQGRVTTLADFRARSTRRLQRAGSFLEDVRFAEQQVCTAIMRKKNGQSPGFDDIHVANPPSWWEEDGVTSLFSFSLYFQAKLHPCVVSRCSDVPTLEKRGRPAPLFESSWHRDQQCDSVDFT